MSDPLDEVIAMWEREDEDEAAEQLASDKDSFDLAQPQTWADVDQPARGAANIAQAAATVAPRPRPEVPAPEETPAAPAPQGGRVPPQAVPSRVAPKGAAGVPPDSLDWKGLSERLRNAELRAAQTRAGEQMRANIIPGYKPDLAGAQAQVDAVKRPVELAQTRQAMETRDLANRVQRSGLEAKAAMDDPNSLQSQKAREAVRAMGIDLPDLDMFSANDIQRFVKTGDFRAMQESKRRAEQDALKAQADANKAERVEGELENSRKAFANELKDLGIDPTKASQKDIDRAISLRHAKATEAQARASLAHSRDKEDDKKTEDIPPDYEIAPGANPGSDSRKKFTALVASRNKLKQLTSRMREKTANMTRLDRVDDFDALNQLATQIGIEAKNVADLGALSGPDMGLMEAMVQNPTSAWNILRDSDVAKNMGGLDAWADDSVAAGEKTYGLRRKGGGAAQPQKIRVRRKADGKTGSLLPSDFNPDLYEKI